METHLPSQFRVYLEGFSVSRKTVINYLSDLSHFIAWALFWLKTSGYQVSRAEDIAPYFSSELIIAYKKFLIANSVPAKTTNRRLSTLRHFGRFLIQAGFTLANPADDIPNLPPDFSHNKLLFDFREYLEQDGITKKTIRNYLSDTNDFLRFLEKNTLISKM